MAGGPLRGGDDLPGDMPEIRLPVFQGPLDLLLHLIERDDLDITAVSLVAVADQYLAAIHQGEVSLEGLAEFVAIGAKLIYLKSVALLPRQAEAPAEALEEDEVGRELVDLLREYRRFAEIADVLQNRQEQGLRLYPRLAAQPVVDGGPGLDSVTLDTLRAIMLRVLERRPDGPMATIERDPLITVLQRLELFRERLRRTGRFSFRRAISECRTRAEVIIAFLAVLELLKSGECEARQSAIWADIEVVAASGALA